MQIRLTSLQGSTFEDCGNECREDRGVSERRCSVLSGSEAM